MREKFLHVARSNYSSTKSIVFNIMNCPRLPLPLFTRPWPRELTEFPHLDVFLLYVKKLLLLLQLLVHGVEITLLQLVKPLGDLVRNYLIKINKTDMIIPYGSKN